MYGDARRQKKRDQLGTQVDVYNIHSGRLVTMDDDGVDAEGQPNQQRRHLIRKLGMEDKDEDPMFALVRPLPKRVLENDARADGMKLKNTRSLDDKSNHPDFKTLGDKYKANEQAREEHMRDFNERRYGSKEAPGRSKLKASSPKVAAKVTAEQKAAKAKANKAAAGAVKAPS